MGVWAELEQRPLQLGTGGEECKCARVWCECVWNVHACVCVSAGVVVHCVECAWCTCVCVRVCVCVCEDDTLFYCRLLGTPLYRVNTPRLRDRQKPHNFSRQAGLCSRPLKMLLSIDLP